MKVASSKPYDDKQHFIKIIQTDYAHIRMELLNLSSTLREKEIRLSRLVGASLVDSDNVDSNFGINSERHFNSRRSAGVNYAGGAQSSDEKAGYLLSLDVHCLGKFQVRVDSKEVVGWRSLKAKSLLKYLLLGNREHSTSRDMLMEALWPGCEPSTANNNLKVAVLALRKTLESNHSQNGSSQVVLFRDSHYLINPGIDLYVDAEQFEYHCNSGTRLEREQRENEAIAEYKSAVALYKGDFLEEDMYDDWSLIKRETLKDKYLTIVCKLADHSMSEADYAGAIGYCEKVLEKDRCREDIYRRLMQCYSRMGQRNRAMGWYHFCEETIKRELDVSPDQDLVALHQKLSKGEYI